MNSFQKYQLDKLNFLVNGWKRELEEEKKKRENYYIVFNKTGDEEHLNAITDSDMRIQRLSETIDIIKAKIEKLEETICEEEHTLNPVYTIKHQSLSFAQPIQPDWNGVIRRIDDTII